MCTFEEDEEILEMSRCNLFSRSFTNKGMGFTFNNEKEEKLLKEDFRNHPFSPNQERDPSLMKSATIEDSLRVVVENNAEEVEKYDSTKSLSIPEGDLTYEPLDVTVTIHDPKEPANIRSRGFKVPLGQKTIVYMTPKARKIDDSGIELTEAQRRCRLDDETDSLDIFNVYTRSACLFECKLKNSLAKGRRYKHKNILTNVARIKTTQSPSQTVPKP